MASQPSYAQVLMHMALRYFNLISTNIQSKIFYINHKKILEYTYGIKHQDYITGLLCYKILIILINKPVIFFTVVYFYVNICAHLKINLLCFY